MRLRIHPVAFMVSYLVTYMLVFFKNWPLFRYYPLHKDFTWGIGTLPPSAGPAMAWYGFLAAAFITALIVGTLVPDGILKVFRGRLWLFPLISMLISIFLLRHLLFV